MSPSLRPIAFVTATLLGQFSMAQCPSGFITIDSQAAVDAFAVGYPDCLSLPGSMSISGADITDLSAFDNLTHIEGTVEFIDLTLSDINAFNNLSVVGGQLWITQCGALTAISGFTSLDTVAEALIFWQNPALATIDGFPDLDACVQNLTIGENDALENVLGFAELDTLGSLSISANPVLTNINGLDHEIPIGVYVELINNPMLSACGVQALCDYGERTEFVESGVNGNGPGCEFWTNVQDLCDGLSVAENPTQILTVSPNPTSNILHIAGLQEVAIEALVMDPTGRVVHRAVVRDGSMDVQHLASGHYTLHMTARGAPIRATFLRE